MEIGAAVTHREIERSAVVRERHARARGDGALGRQHPRAHGGHARRQPVLQRPALRPGDVPPRGRRRGRASGGAASPRACLPLEEFLRGPYETALAEGDLLVSIRVPATRRGDGHRAPQARLPRAARRDRRGLGARRRRERRGGADRRRLGRSGGVEGERGGVAPGRRRAAPRRSPLRRREACSRIEDADGSEEYKRQLVRVLVGRALAEALGGRDSSQARQRAAKTRVSGSSTRRRLSAPGR